MFIVRLITLLNRKLRKKNYKKIKNENSYQQIPIQIFFLEKQL